MKFKLAPILVAVVIIGILGLSSLFTVSEGYEGVLLRLGKIQQDSSGQAVVKFPGLHFKLPIVNQVRIFDVRLQTLDIQSSRIVTAEKKDVIVDYYAKWKIAKPALYYTRTGGDELRAQTLLEQQLNDTLRAEFGKRTIQEVVADDRSAIMNKLRTQANGTAQKLGIQVVDVRIKRIDLPPEVSSAVFERMRAERERVATEHRAEGRSKGEAIRAQADANVTITVATAKANAAKIKAEGDAKAAQIYATAYGKDSNFYAFYRSLLAYKSAFQGKKNEVLVLKPDSQFFEYFNSSQGK